MKGDWEEGFPQSQLRVLDPVAISPRAVRELWRFLFGVDLVQRVRGVAAPARTTRCSCWRGSRGSCA